MWYHAGGKASIVNQAQRQLVVAPDVSACTFPCGAWLVVIASPWLAGKGGQGVASCTGMSHVQPCAICCGTTLGTEAMVKMETKRFWVNWRKEVGEAGEAKAYVSERCRCRRNRYGSGGTSLPGLPLGSFGLCPLGTLPVCSMLVVAHVCPVCCFLGVWPCRFTPAWTMLVPLL